MDEAIEVGGDRPEISRPIAPRPFEDFYGDLAVPVRRYATAILRSDDVEDACQEAWFRIWRAWGTADPGRLEAWAFRIVRNCCLDRRREAKPAIPLVEGLLSSDVSQEDAVVSRIDAGRAVELLSGLPLVQREVLWLREAVELSYAEIAQVQDVPIGTVMSRLHKARRRAARALRRWQR